MTIKTFAVAAAISASLSMTAAAQDVVIGLSGALTGPSAGSYAPAIEGIRLYVDKVNAGGGVAGRKIKLIILDDQGEASKGAANATKLISQDNVSLLINSSLSSTFAPMIAATGQAGIPLLFAASACPKEVYPPANPLLFCTTAFASKFDSQATLDFITKSGGNVSLGLVAMAIPISRSEIESAEGLATVKGMKVADKAIIPPPTPDYTPFATKLSAAGANWVYAWAPWVTQVRTFEGLRKIGWNGRYIAWAHLESESELARLKDPALYAIGANALFAQDLPVQREMQATAKAAGATYPASQMTEGWIAGMVLEAALGKAGPNADAKAIQAAMQSLSVDTKGLRGGPIEWTAANHFRTRQFYRIYRWAPTSSAIEVVQDWTAYDVK
ncbi:MAG: ABC transporter substrate-binding protein [Xanthobacteraceae bacterium]|nr:MAG: ABC transporter substrate-binding protein [Xanthobacteraceae bacterium]